ncbi:MAG: hypothetical protein LBQ33_05305, partial [Oscillospiraceae bacterium]|nr:hypothetical protein [Oscillospiraceae bacterium]
MTRALFRDTLRAIRKTFSRFLSIVIIVALGVGFFAGLKAVSPNMKSAADSFYRALGLADIVLTSTVGFDAVDVQAVLDQPGVAAATPARDIDGLLYKDGALEQSMSGTAYVLRVIGYDFSRMSNAEDNWLNRIELVAGRLPEAPNECLVSVYESTMDPAHFALGGTVTVKGDHEDLLASIKNTEFTVVGTIHTPEFVSMELGPSQAGGGELSGYIYVPDDVFLWDYYTKLFVSVAGTEQLEAYTAEYNAAVRPVKEQLESVSGAIVQSRAERLRETHEPQLIAGKEELERKRKELAAGLAKAQEDIAKVKKAATEGSAQYQAEKAKAEKQLAKAQSDYEAGKKEYQKNLALYNENKAKYDEGLEIAKQHPNAMAEYISGKNKIEQMSASLEIAGAAILAGKSAIRVMNQALASGEDARIQNAMKIFSKYYPLSEEELTIEGMKAQVAQAQAQLDAQQAELEEGEKQLAQGKKQLAEAEPLIRQLEELTKAGEQLQEAEKELTAARAKLMAAPAQIEAAEKRMHNELASAQRDLANAQGLAQTVDEDYAKTKADYDQQIADAERAIFRGENQLAALPNAQWIVSDRDEFAGYTNYGDTAENMQSFALVFPVLFFLIAALVSLTTMTRMVEDERTQLGVLKAAGYSAGAIAFKYLFYAFTAGLLGSILGLALGFSLIPLAIFKAYSILYLIPEMTPAFYLDTSAIGLGAAVLSTVGAVIFSVLRSLRLKPAQLMRPKAPKAGKRVLFE